MGDVLARVGASKIPQCEKVRWRNFCIATLIGD
jgi:hypothetical protein